MEISNFAECVRNLAHFCHTIPTEACLKLESSLVLLKANQRLESLYLVGQLRGQSNVYWLAFGAPEMALFREQKFFYTRNGIDWFRLLEPTVWSDDWSRIREQFTGDVCHVFQLELGRRPTEEGAPACLEVLEQDRLWYVFRSLLREAACLPRGLLYWSDGKEVVLNPHFRGLTEDELSELSNYQHFRPPERDAETNLRGRHECNLSVDVFDRIEDVLPHGKSFVLRLDGTGRFAHCSSLYWLGLVSFTRARSADLYGFYYVGDGCKNWDLPFMVDL
ncbi:radial spoke head protein 9 homolog [Anopheles cruzii]|uniref:radial spoke head protein 9 homolog n=1 Tax=Anopheles cruzii TaxID=68878 RepID=UPI0022EC67C6|nr:radial spoke head protein 9 homolog [Anopheles cruzii]